LERLQNDVELRGDQ